MSRTFICFLGARNGDAISPALDPRLGIRHVIIVCHHTKQSRAHGMGEVLLAAGLTCELQAMPSIRRWTEVFQVLQALLVDARQTAEPASWIVNVSGANPLVAAAVSAIVVHKDSGDHLSLCAVNPLSDELCWLHRPPAVALPIDVQDCLTLDGYFAAHGFELVNSADGEPTDPLESTLDLLALQMGDIQFQHPVGTSPSQRYLSSECPRPNRNGSGMVFEYLVVSSLKRNKTH